MTSRFDASLNCVRLPGSCRRHRALRAAARAMEAGFYGGMTIANLGGMPTKTSAAGIEDAFGVRSAAPGIRRDSRLGRPSAGSWRFRSGPVLLFQPEFHYVPRGSSSRDGDRERVRDLRRRRPDRRHPTLEFPLTVRLSPRRPRARRGAPPLPRRPLVRRESRRHLRGVVGRCLVLGGRADEGHVGRASSWRRVEVDVHPAASLLVEGRYKRSVSRSHR